KPVGVLFADLNGLKQANDTKGHSAGDELIRAGARVLRSVFHDEEVFRAGGDEFTVIVVGITAGEMEEKKRQIRERSGNDVNLAIGVSIEKDCRNVRTALRKADEDMYEDKRNYYESHPEMKRRHSDAH
ncbi:MAG: GGDEF domain-containing protein, partial [Clostridia bacterium]|nr:GGDEF domain-containing protein [Clostridia bacterium]